MLESALALIYTEATKEQRDRLKSVLQSMMTKETPKLIDQIAKYILWEATKKQIESAAKKLGCKAKPWDVLVAIAKEKDLKIPKYYEQFKDLPANSGGKSTKGGPGSGPPGPATAADRNATKEGLEVLRQARAEHGGTLTEDDFQNAREKMPPMDNLSDAQLEMLAGKILVEKGLVETASSHVAKAGNRSRAEIEAEIVKLLGGSPGPPAPPPSPAATALLEEMGLDF